MEYNEQKERDYVFNLFCENNAKYRDKRIALYGLGVNTFYILKHNQIFNIVALMDAKKEGSIVEGLPVISVKEAETRVDVVVIIARASVVPIIHSRISSIEKAGVVVVDIFGNPINKDEADQKVTSNPYWNKTYEELKHEIDTHDIITFDVFDTLVMRKIMRPSDLYEVTGHIIKEEFSMDWMTVRHKAFKAAEKKYVQPTYDEIYEEFQQIAGIDNEITRKIKKRELEIDLSYMVPRYVIVNALRYAAKKNKRVFILTDMYYTKQDMLYILKHLNIYGFEELLVSCEERKCKWPSGELFDVFLKKFNMKPDNILHVGDNPKADIELAKRKGISTYHILSAYEMLVQSSFSYILTNARTLEDYIVIGMILAECCNDPFALSKKRGKLYIDSLDSFGYLTYGACFTGFLIWLINKYKDSDRDYILFLARDGFPMYKIYKIFVEKKKISNTPYGKYILASRRALGVASIIDEESFYWALDCVIPALGYQNPGLLLQNRFGILPNDDDADNGRDLSIEEVKQYICKYKEKIIENGKNERTEYLDYLKREGIEENSKVVVFDTRTGGTAAYHFKDVTGMDTELACYILFNSVDHTLYDEDKSFAYIGEDTEGMMRYNYSRLTSLNECIFTSDKPQLLKFEKGRPVFAEPEYSQIYFDKISKVYEGIERFSVDFINLSQYDIKNQNISPKLIDDIIGCIKDKNWILEEEYKRYFAHEDKYSGKSKTIYAL